MKDKYKIGNVISDDEIVTAIGHKFNQKENYSFTTSENLSTEYKMEELKEMVDFIIDNGYEIKTKDFREPFLSCSIGGKYFPNRIEALKDDLLDITIYRNDDIQKTYTYIVGKYKSLKELLSIQDGSIFSKENNELFDYIKSKTNKL